MLFCCVGSIKAGFLLQILTEKLLTEVNQAILISNDVGSLFNNDEVSNS